MLAEISPEETRRALDRVADDLRWEASIDRPPVDAFRVARQLGLRVVSDRSIGERGRFVRGGGRLVGSIVVGPEDRPERRHWAVAHEIGEAFCHRLFELLGVDPREAGPNAREQSANAIAGRLLVPRKWLVGVYRDCGHDLLSTKQQFATASHELVARRLLESWIAPMVVSVFDHDRLVWRRAWNDRRAPPLVRSERLSQRRAHHAGSVVVVQGEPTVRCWPIHEPGWKREIVVTEPRLSAEDVWPADAPAPDDHSRHVA